METKRHQSIKFAFFAALIIASCSLVPKAAFASSETSKDCGQLQLERASHNKPCRNFEVYPIHHLVSKSGHTRAGKHSVRAWAPKGRLKTISFYTGQFGSCFLGQSVVTNVTYNKFSTFNPISTSSTTLGCKSMSVYAP